MRFSIVLPPIETKQGILQARTVLYRHKWKQVLGDDMKRIVAKHLLRQISLSPDRDELRKVVRSLQFELEFPDGTCARAFHHLAYRTVYLKPHVNNAEHNAPVRVKSQCTTFFLEAFPFSKSLAVFEKTFLFIFFSRFSLSFFISILCRSVPCVQLSDHEKKVAKDNIFADPQLSYCEKAFAYQQLLDQHPMALGLLAKRYSTA